MAPYTVHQWTAAGGPPVAALQRERARIAKDLHDELGARLTQITLLRELARQQLSQAHAADTPLAHIADIARQVVAVFQQPAPMADALTEREQEIVQRLAQGLIYKEIADQLGISIGTVRAHICRIYEKLHARSRHEAVLKAFPHVLAAVKLPTNR